MAYGDVETTSAEYLDVDAHGVSIHYCGRLTELWLVWAMGRPGGSRQAARAHAPNVASHACWQSHAFGIPPNHFHIPTPSSGRVCDVHNGGIGSRRVGEGPSKPPPRRISSRRGLTVMTRLCPTLFSCLWQSTIFFHLCPKLRIPKDWVSWAIRRCCRNGPCGEVQEERACSSCEPQNRI